jgi:hypothetical protein
LIQQARFVSECPTTGLSVSVHGPDAPGAVRMIGRNELRPAACGQVAHFCRDPTARRVQSGVHVQMPELLNTDWFENSPSTCDTTQADKPHTALHDQNYV